MDKREAKVLKKKLANKKLGKLYAWFFKALPVMIFTVISIGLISFLLWYGEAVTHDFDVDLGGGTRIENLFPPADTGPLLPPILELPPRPGDLATTSPEDSDTPTPSPTPESPDYPCGCYSIDCTCPSSDTPIEISPTPPPTYVPCDLPPIPANLQHDTRYAAIIAIGVFEFTITFDTQKRNASLTFLRGSILYTLDGTFEAVGTNRLRTTMGYADTNVVFIIEVELESVTILDSPVNRQILDIIGYTNLNPFSPNLVMHADWTT
ncbi:MAG: hypothetical protein FWC82_04170 [Firmicutes bacterium]|nr:hypothetical protein [Bacillota bacterium]